MPKGVYKLPEVKNEPVLSYAPGSPERQALKLKLAELSKGGLDIYVTNSDFYNVDNPESMKFRVVLMY